MTPVPSDQQTDAALTAFLDDLSRDTAEAPSTAEMKVRVSLGRGTAGRSSQRWQLVLAIGLMIAVAASAALVGDRLDLRRPQPSQVPLPSDVAPAPSSQGSGAACNIDSVTLRLAHAAPPPMWVGSGARMAHGAASWLESLNGSTGLIIFQDGGGRLPVTLADMAWPNGLPNATGVTQIAPDRSMVVVSIAQSSSVAQMRCSILDVLPTTGDDVRTLFHGEAGLVGTPLGFSPDSALLAFIESDYRSGGVATTLHVVTPTGDVATEPETFDCDTIRAAWAPVARRLAVACAGGADEILVIDLDGERRTYPWSGAPIAALGWSGDGKTALVASVDGEGTNGLAIDRLHESGGAPDRTTATFRGVEVGWKTPYDPWAFSPDGRELLAISGPPPGVPGGLHIGERPLLVATDDGAVQEIDVAVPGVASHDVAWTADGSALVTRVPIDDPGLLRLVAVTPGGSSRVDAGVVTRNAMWIADSP